jgi:D-glycero-D-manno-heptose 1,7-bisphosphate phosphatase
MMRGLFLDRDGTLIVDVGYPKYAAAVEILPGAVAALKSLAHDWVFVVVSNQSGIGRGLISPLEATEVHDRFIELFAAEGVAFAHVAYCPHAPEAGCPCRKPAPGMLIDAARALNLDLATSVMIGDKESDLQAAFAAGVRGIRFANDWAAIALALRGP